MSENKSDQVEEIEIKAKETDESAAEPAAAEPAAAEPAAAEPAAAEPAAAEPAAAEPAAAEPAAAEPAAAEPAAAEPTAVASDEIDISDFVWPTDPEHTNAVQLLSEQVAGVDIVHEPDHESAPSKALNLILVLMVIGVGGFGAQMLTYYSSADREAREMETAACKVEMNTREQLLADKQVGTLRIETEPKQAKIERSINGEPYEVIKGKTAAGEEIDALTPADFKNLDINQGYKFRLTFTDTLKRFKEDEEEKGKKGKKADKEADKEVEAEKKEREVEELKVAYRTEEFYVARYQWIQDGATGSFRTQKIINLVPQDVEHYYTFDWKSGKDQTFETMSECEAFARDNDATICRPIPAVKNWETEDARREAEAKKSKRGKRGRRRGRRRR